MAYTDEWIHAVSRLDDDLAEEAEWVIHRCHDMMREPGTVREVGEILDLLDDLAWILSRRAEIRAIKLGAGTGRGFDEKRDCRALT